LKRRLRIVSSCSMVMLFPFGTPGQCFETGSVSASLPSCTCCRMTVPTQDFVTEPTRIFWSYAVGVEPL
jgi:hypothetical protein